MRKGQRVRAADRVHREHVPRRRGQHLALIIAGASWTALAAAALLLLVIAVVTAILRNSPEDWTAKK